MWKSTIDCENNYIYHKYVTQYLNTITGFSPLLSAIYFFVVRWKDIGKIDKIHIENFYNIFTYLFIISIGACLSHSSFLYQYQYQLLNELPILLLAFEYIKLLISLKTTRYTLTKNTIGIRKLIFNTILVIPGLYVLSPIAQQLGFHITLKILEGYLVYLFLVLDNTLNIIVGYDIFTPKFKPKLMSSESFKISCYKNNESLYKKVKKYIQACQRIHKMYKNVLGIYGICGTIWFIDNLYCNHIEWMQLHAHLHILSSIGIYYLNNILLEHVLIANLLK